VKIRHVTSPGAWRRERELHNVNSLFRGCEKLYIIITAHAPLEHVRSIFLRNMLVITGICVHGIILLHICASATIWHTKEIIIF